MNLLNHCFFNNIVNGLIYVLVFGDTNFFLKNRFKYFNYIS